MIAAKMGIFTFCRPFQELRFRPYIEVQALIRRIASRAALNDRHRPHSYIRASDTPPIHCAIPLAPCAGQLRTATLCCLHALDITHRDPACRFASFYKRKPAMALHAQLSRSGHPAVTMGRRLVARRAHRMVADECNNVCAHSGAYALAVSTDVDMGPAGGRKYIRSRKCLYSGFAVSLVFLPRV